MVGGNSDRNGPIVLAHVAPFRLGEVEVDPATRQLIRDGRSETLEPRVMQVLVALAQARGAVLTRDELTERCWGGRIVGENAINRVISRIRQVAADFGMDSFQLETITKVGYRMIVSGSAREPAPVASHAAEPVLSETRDHSGAPDRRTVIGGALAAVGLGAAGFYLWQARRGHSPPDAAVELFRRGELAQRQALPDQNHQAVAFFRQAVELDPLYAAAWGALALSYRHILEGGTRVKEEESLADLIRSAARRALALDPDNVDAHLALISIKPHYRRWAESEANLRRLLARYSGHWLARAQLGLVLYDVGRWEEGLVHSRNVVELDPFLPQAHAILSRALSGVGRLQEAQSVLEAALKRWPGHPVLWNTQFNFLVFGGRPAAAAAFVRDPDMEPTVSMAPTAISNRVVLARAIEHRAPADVNTILATYRAQLLDDVGNTSQTAAVFAALGKFDLVFTALDAYFFNSGPMAGNSAPIGPYTRRPTSFLFAPPMRPARADPRFATLVRNIELERYWRATRTTPDYRR